MAGGGGAWKVAYADFVTAMMAFFMVMWLIAQSDKVKDSVAKHFRNPNGRYAPGDSLLPPRNDQYFKERRRTAEKGESPPSIDLVAQESKRAYMLAINNGYRTSIGTVVLFAKDSAELSDANKDLLKSLVPQIIGKPQKIEIRGHSSRRGGATEPGSGVWNHSFDRCVNVLKFLESQGIPAERCRLSQAGATEPYETNRSSADEHSRVEVFLLSEVASDALGTKAELEHRYRASEGE